MLFEQVVAPDHTAKVNFSIYFYSPFLDLLDETILRWHVLMKKFGGSRNRTWTSRSGSESANHETTNTDFLVAGQFNRVARDRLEHQRLQSNQLNGSAAVADRDLSHRFRERASDAFRRLKKKSLPRRDERGHRCGEHSLARILQNIVNVETYYLQMGLSRTFYLPFCLFYKHHAISNR